MLELAFATIAPVILRPVKLAQRRDYLLEHRREEKEIDQLGIKLRSATTQDDLGGGHGVPAGTVSSGVGDRVVRVGDAHDPGLDRNRFSAEPGGIAGAVPALVMTEHAGAEIRIEARHRLEHLGATLRMGGDQLPFRGRELMIVVNHVIDRRVDLADVVEERDALDASATRFIEVGGTSEDQRVGRYAPDVSTRLVVIGVDRVEQRLECGSRKSLRGLAGGGLTRGEQASDRPDREAWNRTQHSIFFSHGVAEGKKWAT
jgi:hypothetical protein